MGNRTIALALALTLGLGGTAAVTHAKEARSSAARPVPVAAHAKLFALFKAADEANLKLNPLDALVRGDLRYADRFGDYLSNAYEAASRAQARKNLAALHAIDRTALGDEDKVIYDVFANRQQRTLRATEPSILAITHYLPIDQMSGLQVGYPSMVSGRGSAPFNSTADYDANLKRVDGFVHYLDTAIMLMREGMARKVTQPKAVVEAMLRQLDGLVAQGVDNSTFMGPTKAFPDAVKAADRTRLTAAYRAATQAKLVPAITRLRDFLRNDYLPAARTSIGLSALPGGDKLYAVRIENSTTLPLSADEVHQLGLKEVARIRSEMEAIRQQIGFQGDLKALFEYLRSEPRFRFASETALGDHYREIAKVVAAHVPEQFGTVPKSPLEIRPVPDFRAPSSAPAYYEEGTPDGARPGVFYYNAYDLPTRTSWSMDAYYLHEGIPGHHFQISIAQEDASLPDFMRFGGDTAFVEGWALYAESLWKEMGVETDPYTRFGGLNAEIWRAIRLVLDSGIHAKGWTRDQAIQYFLENSGVSKTDATAEVDRYIAIPGQALSYKVGQITISGLKQEAQAALGGRFDPRAFHAQVIGTGSLPLPVLQAKVRAWIAAQRPR
ncbi:MAG TPA: DUF885 domain-containing protein [Sphingobium sp.]